MTSAIQNVYRAFHIIVYSHQYFWERRRFFLVEIEQPKKNGLLNLRIRGMSRSYEHPEIHGCMLQN